MSRKNKPTPIIGIYPKVDKPLALPEGKRPKNMADFLQIGSYLVFESDNVISETQHLFWLLKMDIQRWQKDKPYC